MKNLLFLLLIGLMAIACQPNDSQKSDQTTETNGEVYDSSSMFHVAEVPSFIIDNYTDDNDVPRSTISIDMYGQRIEVTEALEVQRIEAKDYYQYEIPAGAVDACGGWWAGSGEYYYIIEREDGKYFMIMKAEVSEEEEAVYKYTSIMNFARKK